MTQSLVPDPLSAANMLCPVLADTNKLVVKFSSNDSRTKKPF
jgi:hypothetical protein